MLKHIINFYLLALALVASNLSFAEFTKLEEVVIEASLNHVTLQEATSAISIIDEDQIQKSQSTFISDILTQAPNVNFSSGASRGRFFQIRGTGERSQFIDPINPSVGLIIDGIDFSGAGNVANLFDVEKVEILRGPQGTAFGINASAGLINIITTNPSDAFYSRISSSIGSVAGNRGSLDSYSLGAIFNGSLSDTITGRLSAQKLSNDGFVNNKFLNRDDTSKIDEGLIRGKLNWQVNDDLTLNTSILYSDVDNGYDAFTLDNTRDTITDEPGHDRQETIAIGIQSKYTLDNNIVWQTNLSISDIDTSYAYDEDWTFTGFHPFGYTSFDQYDRDRENQTLDTRLTSSTNELINWSAGIYFRNQSVDLLRNYTFSSKYDTENTAIYGEAHYNKSEDLTLSAGLRVEAFEAKYRDNLSSQFNPSETLWGGHIAANYVINNEVSVFSRLSKGFKAAGVNSENGNAIPAQNSTYETESLYNFEIGANLQNHSGTFNGQVVAFYQERHDAQIKQSLAISQANDGNCPCDFEDYIDNANETENFGLELEGSFQAHQNLELITSIGYLEAEFSDYQRISEGAEGTELVENLNGRQVANAPEYTFSVSADWALTDKLSFWLQVEGKDSYFFSNRHELRSNAYELINTRLTYSQNSWEVSLWAKNLTDEDYTVRGFGSFNNDPRDNYSDAEPYFQFGSPREVGLSASYTFE